MTTRLQKLVDNGPNPPPGETGAKNIIREDGRRINLAVLKSGADRRLEIGDRVGEPHESHAGDVRRKAPVQHAKVHPLTRTVRVHVCICHAGAAISEHRHLLSQLA